MKESVERSSCYDDDQESKCFSYRIAWRPFSTIFQKIIGISLNISRISSEFEFSGICIFSLRLLSNLIPNLSSGWCSAKAGTIKYFACKSSFTALTILMQGTYFLFQYLVIMWYFFELSESFLEKYTKK